MNKTKILKIVLIITTMLVSFIALFVSLYYLYPDSFNRIIQDKEEVLSPTPSAEAEPNSTECASLGEEYADWNYYKNDLHSYSLCYPKSWSLEIPPVSECPPEVDSMCETIKAEGNIIKLYSKDDEIDQPDFTEDMTIAFTSDKPDNRPCPYGGYEKATDTSIYENIKIDAQDAVFAYGDEYGEIYGSIEDHKTSVDLLCPTPLIRNGYIYSIRSGMYFGMYLQKKGEKFDHATFKKIAESIRFY